MDGSTRQEVATNRKDLDASARQEVATNRAAWHEFFKGLCLNWGGGEKTEEEEVKEI